MQAPAFFPCSTPNRALAGQEERAGRQFRWWGQQQPQLSWQSPRAAVQYSLPLQGLLQQEEVQGCPQVVEQESPWWRQAEQAEEDLTCWPQRAEEPEQAAA
jgi:hypothetical protein